MQKELNGNYSLYVYTPARFDYPFDYLIDYYYRSSKIDLPKENQKRFYLIIRDDPAHTYLTSGWYSDKVKNMPTLRVKKEYPGFIFIEKHESI